MRISSTWNWRNWITWSKNIVSELKSIQIWLLSNLDSGLNYYPYNHEKSISNLYTNFSQMATHFSRCCWNIHRLQHQVLDWTARSPWIFQQWMFGQHRPGSRINKKTYSITASWQKKYYDRCQWCRVPHCHLFIYLFFTFIFSSFLNSLTGNWPKNSKFSYGYHGIMAMLVFMR